MEIFGVGGPEMLFILVIALILIGPRDLGKTGKAIGRFLNQLYRSEGWRTLNEASRTIRTLPNRLAREAALDELDQARKDIIKSGDDLAKPISESTKGLQAWTPSRKPQPNQSKEDPPPNQETEPTDEAKS